MKDTEVSIETVTTSLTSIHRLGFLAFHCYFEFNYVIGMEFLSLRRKRFSRKTWLSLHVKFGALSSYIMGLFWGTFSLFL